jgi:hypothetical protein
MGHNLEREREIRQERRTLVNGIRDKTPCAECGAPMRDWHHPDHSKHPNRRVGVLAGTGASERVILAEIDACEPLCRSCHVKRHGLNGVCRNGHDLTDETNLRKGKLAQGIIACRLCHNAAQLERTRRRVG